MQYSVGLFSTLGRGYHQYFGGNAISIFEGVQYSGWGDTISTGAG